MTTIHSNKRSRARLYIVAGLLLVCLLILASKAAHLQLVLGEDLRELAEAQYRREFKFSSPRGTIVDRGGRTLAKSVSVWSVAADPTRVKNAEEISESLATILAPSQEELTRRLSSKRSFIWLERRVAPEVAAAVRESAAPGIFLKQESRRYYPGRALAGQLLGAVNIDGKGIDGLELTFDHHLRGRSAKLHGLRDNRKRRLMIGETIDLSSLEGDTVELTIDARVQHMVEAALQRAVKESDAKSGLAVVMNPKTGAVLAMANAPAFNPNDARASGTGARRNHALTDAFEPGSIFKIMTFAAALEEGKLTPEEQIFCENGRIKIGRHTIRDLHKSGWLKAREVFSHSSNIGSIKIVQRVGEKPFRRYLDQLGFGAKTGTGLTGEAKGRLPKKKRWGDVRLATSSYGHGLLVSPLQMAVLVSSIANGGHKVRPHVVSRIVSPGGQVLYQEDASLFRERVWSEETSKTLTDIMGDVVKEGGTGTRAQIDGVRVAGKTGTAEKVDPATGTYSRKLHLSSFVGFAPLENPEIAVVIMIDEPKKRRYGDSAAGPAFAETVRSYLSQEGYLSSKELPAPLLQDKGVQPAPVEPDTVVSSPEPLQINKAGEVQLDLVGQPMRVALREIERAELRFELTGNGVVVFQDPPAGSMFSPGDLIRLRLESAP